MLWGFSTKDKLIEKYQEEIKDLRDKLDEAESKKCDHLQERSPRSISGYMRREFACLLITRNHELEEENRELKEKNDSLHDDILVFSAKMDAKT
jgi:hypothetical protein